MIEVKQESEGRQPRKPFLLYMHYFRAFAIMNIVLTHVLIVPETCDTRSTAEYVRIIQRTLFHSSTLYFVFISGFLFYYLSCNFSILKYYKSKLLNVLLPYLIICCAVFTLQYLNRGIWEGMGQYISKLVNGTVQYPYWYIPFVSLIFFVSPLLLKIPRQTFQNIAVILLLFPLLGTRTSTDITIGQYVYFVPAYLGGMLFAMKSEYYILVIEKNVSVFKALAFLFTTIILFLSLNEVHLRIGPFDFMETLFYVQKISIAFVVIVMLKKYESQQLILFDYFAQYSFAIYFLHTLVDYGVMRTYFFCNVFSQDLFLPFAFLYGIAILFLTLGVSVCLKKIFGKHSRKIIGA